jgi:hypothetical protein
LPRESFIAHAGVYFPDTGSSAYANAFIAEWDSVRTEKSQSWAELEMGILCVTLTYLDEDRPCRIYKTGDGFDVKVYEDREESRIDSEARAPRLVPLSRIWLTPSVFALVRAVCGGALTH